MSLTGKIVGYDPGGNGKQAGAGYHAANPAFPSKLASQDPVAGWDHFWWFGGFIFGGYNLGWLLGGLFPEAATFR